MPILTVQDHCSVQIPAGIRLVKALVDEAKADQLHACGGNARCTTCRVKFISGEPDQMTVAERDLRKVRGIDDPGVRLSCQILCENDMSIELISRLAGSGRKDQGSPVDDAIHPQPVEWV